MMFSFKIAMALLCAGAVAQSGLAAEIPAGSHVLLRMQNTVSTRTAAEGDYVYLRTTTPIAAGGEVVVPAGSYVQGVVAQVERPGRVRGRASMAIRLQTITLNNGTVYQVAPRLASVDGAGNGQSVREENTIEQSSSVGQDISPVVFWAARGAVIGAIAGRRGSALRGVGIGAGAGAGIGVAQALLTRGREVILSQGMTVDVVFDQTVELE